MHNALFWQWSSTLYTAAISFLLSVFLARVLGAEGFGDYSYLLSIAWIFMILQDGGYKTLLFREQVDKKVDDNITDRLAHGLAHLLLITLLGSGAILLIQPQNWLALLFAIFCTGLMVSTEFVSSLFKGRGWFKQDAIWKASVRSVTALSAVIVIYLVVDNDFVSQVSVDKITLLFIGAALSLLVLLLLAIVNGWLCLPSFNLKNGFLRANLAFLTIDVATVLYFRSDIVLLEYFGGNAEEVGHYAAAYRVLSGFILLATPIAQISFRSLRLRIDDIVAFKQLFSWLLLIMLLAAGSIVTVGTIWGDLFIELVFGSGYKAAGDILFVLLFSLLFILPNYILTQGAIALNQEKSYAWIAVSVALLNIILNLIVIPEYGAVGAAWTTVIAEGSLCLGMSVVLWKGLQRHKKEIICE